MATIRNYYRILPGSQNKDAEKFHQEEFIGVGYGIDMDVSKLPDDLKEFNRQLIPYYLKKHPIKSKVAAGLACGAVYTIAKRIKQGDIVLCPGGDGSYWFGEVVGDYSYHSEGFLHRRAISWYPQPISPENMSQNLKVSVNSRGALINITEYADEIENFVTGKVPANVAQDNEVPEERSVFRFEKHLENFLLHNWDKTPLGKDYDIYEDDNGSGQQYPTDTGRIDILAISKNKKNLLVVELKRDAASDAVVGQIQRYMGYVKEELAGEEQSVHGVIIGLKEGNDRDDVRIRRALQVATNIDFYQYEVSFKLFKT